MKFVAALPLLAGAHLGQGAAGLAVTPIQKVLQLLDGMQAKGKQEKHDEETEFAKFTQWCDSTRQATTKSIEQGGQQIEQLEADIAKAEADAERLSAEVATHDTQAAKAETELDQAKAVRKQEHADFIATEADLGESVDAIERAVGVLRSREHDVPQSSLLQVTNMPGMPEDAKSVIESFMAMSSEDGLAAPSANAYESQSGGVVAMLEKLRHQFQDQKLALQKAEMNAKANFELLAQSLKDNILDDSRRSKDKSGSRARRLESAAVAKGDRASTQQTKAEDQSKLDDTLTACHARSAEFEKNQNVRAEEIKAINQAMEILQSDAVSGNAGTYLPKLVQLSAKPHTALVQLRGQETPQDQQIRSKLRAFLQGRAEQTGSRYLALVATHASADPFAKVKQMVKDLIVKLMEQANSEADKKAYCDTELATNKLTRENKQSEVEELSAHVDKHVAESAQLADEVTGLSDALLELRKEQAEATKMRGQEKASNTQTVADAKEAQLAVEKAMKVLRDFYQQAGEGALIQEPYAGQQAEHGGVVGFLEVILSDFARLETETSSAEDQAATAYQRFMDESNQDIAVKETASKHKDEKKRGVDTATANLKRELGLTQEELDAATTYYDKLKPDCVDNGLSYADRVRMREEEVQSLKEALNILNQQDLA